MRTVLLLAALVLALPSVSAHGTHGLCSSTTAVPGGLVHVDRYGGRCTGVVVLTAVLWCEGGSDLHVGGLHVLVFYGSACETGVIVDVLRDDAATLP
ncbi:MAG TPA: hypothetical protein VNX21_02665 [Candidatus Thermoplasmatota archaeon]|nr:hypothetical protein [Candidatus Thermoplasmatota archaeon]